jgi:hypothetical protein
MIFLKYKDSMIGVTILLSHHQEKQPSKTSIKIEVWFNNRIKSYGYFDMTKPPAETRPIPLIYKCIC